MSGSNSDREALALFKRFLAERWFGGPDFESWILEHAEHEAELRRLRDEWLAELRDPGSSAPVPGDLVRMAGTRLAGEIIAGFRLHRRLGWGASGEVWEAEEIELGNRRVALKLLRPDLLLDDRALGRFRNEAFAGALVRHPGVVTVYSTGREHGQPYIAMELVEDGLTLGGWLEARRKEAEPKKEHCRRSIDLVLQAAEALSAAHAVGVLHRDIKPGNILVGREERVKVADFGLARVLAEGGLSRTGDVMGTPAYMSPEQVRGEVHRLDGRTDVFSLGATLYELATFQRAFPGRVYEEIARAIQFLDPPRLRSVDPEIPRDLELVVSRALEKHPDERYPSMRDFARDLACLQAGEPPLARSTTFFARVRKWTRRHPTLAVSLPLCATALLALFAYHGVQSGQIRDSARAELFARAELAVEQGHLDRAHALVREADGYGSDDPTGWLILAAGHSQNGQMEETEQALREARARGFSEDPSRIHTALEHQAYGVFLQYKRDFSLYPEAEEQFLRAMELEPERWRLLYTIYQLRVAVGNVEGARAALDALLPHVPEAEPFRSIVRALLLELAGDPLAAWAELEQLRARPGLAPEDLVQLRWARHAGRVLTRLGEYEEAERYLSQAIQEAPNDCWSLDALAILHFEELRKRGSDPGRSTLVRGFADRATACSASLPTPYLLRAWLLATELERVPAARRSATGLSDKIVSELEAVAQAPAEIRAQAARIRSYLLRLQAEEEFAARRFDRVLALCRQAIELDALDWEAQALGAQAAWWVGDHAAGLAVLDLASGNATTETKADRVARAKVYVWGLGHAKSLGDAERFARSRAAFAAELAGGTSYSCEDLVNAAEFLGTAPEGMRDCDLTLQLLDEPGVLDYFKAHQPGILEAIEVACE